MGNGKENGNYFRVGLLKHSRIFSEFGKSDKLGGLRDIRGYVADSGVPSEKGWFWLLKRTWATRDLTLPHSCVLAAIQRILNISIRGSVSMACFGPMQKG